MPDADRERRFAHGEAIALREIWGGRVWTALPAIVVEDGPDLVALYVPAGARRRRPVAEDGTHLRLPDRPWLLAEETWRVETLRLSLPGCPYSFQLHWASRPRRPERWYINMEDPLQRAPSGFDTMDYILDLVVSVDLGSARWKDLDEFKHAHARGLVGETTAAEWIAKGEEALRRLREGRAPLDGRWTAWRPDERWPIPTLLRQSLALLGRPLLRGIAS